MNLHLSKGGESIEDTAKILSNFGDAFMLRTDNDKKLEEFKKYLSIPIINGLSPIISSYTNFVRCFY